MLLFFCLFCLAAALAEDSVLAPWAIGMVVVSSLLVAGGVALLVWFLVREKSDRAFVWGGSIMGLMGLIVLSWTLFVSLRRPTPQKNIYAGSDVAVVSVSRETVGSTDLKTTVAVVRFADASTGKVISRDQGVVPGDVGFINYLGELVVVRRGHHDYIYGYPYYYSWYGGGYLVFFFFFFALVLWGMCFCYPEVEESRYLESRRRSRTLDDNDNGLKAPLHSDHDQATEMKEFN